MRDLDCSMLPVGPPATWPQGLRIAVSVLLHSRCAMAVWWGRELTCFYNDACRPLLGSKHPAALGKPAREIWAKEWDRMGRHAEAALRGQAACEERLPFRLDRYGYPEEAYLSWSYSPIPDERGGVGGVLCTITEETQRVLRERARAEEDRYRVDGQATGELTGEASVASSTTAGARVLLAEDDPALRAYVRRVLGSLYRVEAVPDGEAALEAARRDPPDLVLADVMMPNLDGFALLRALRADPAGATLPVILVSARAGEESRVAGMGAGADDYLVKPFRGRELLARVDAHLRLSRMRRQTEQALADSEQRFRAIFEQAAVGIAVCSVDGRFFEVNPGLCNILGYTAEEMTQLGVADITPPEDLEEEQMQASRVLAGEIDGYTMEKRYVRKDGAIVWVEVSSSVVRDRHGGALYTVGIVQEFTERKRAEEALRRSEERYRLVADTTNDAVWDWDLQSDQIGWNQAMAERFGWTEALGGTSLAWWEERVHPDDRARVSASLHAVAEGHGDHWQEEYRFLCADGTYANVLDRGSAVQDASGQTVRMLGAMLDFTERVRAEEAIAREREQLERLVDAVPVMITMYSPSTRLTRTNRAFERIMGWSTEDAAHMDLIEACYPDPAYRKEVRDSMRSLAPGWRDMTATARDGSPVESSWANIQLPGGTLVGIGIDIRERKAAERAVREGEERLRLATEAGGIGIFEWDLQTNRLQWSEMTRVIFGLPPGAEPSLAVWQSGIHPEDRERVESVVQGALERGDRYHFEHRVVRCDGEVRWVESTARVTKDAEGQPASLRGAVQDITERKRFEEERTAILDSERAARAEAERANRLKDDFLAVMSHELRTPLNAILGWTQMLRRGTLPPSSAAKALEVIERNTLVQAQLIADLLDVSRITSGKLKLETGRADLALAVEAALDSVRQAATAKEVRLERNLGGAPAWVMGDPARLQQVVWNLISNAVKFSPAGGRVWVSLACRDSRAVISVKDEGQGIRPEFLPHLFERFSQADSSAARRHGGLGLGLSIVKHLVDLHGGAVRAESEGEGRGATFLVELPLAGQDASTKPAGGGLAPGAMLGDLPELTGLRVLVVDDEDDARELVRRVLAESGAEARTAGSVAEALEQLARERPDVVVSDLGMPGEDGFQLIRSIRAGEGEPRLPAVAVTAFARAEDRERTLAAGFDAHVAKPLDLRELLGVLVQVTGRGAG